mgnify:FL=1|jgi:Periplasmic component of the Tol biopolymer transport system
MRSRPVLRSGPDPRSVPGALSRPVLRSHPLLALLWVMLSTTIYACAGPGPSGSPTPTATGPVRLEQLPATDACRASREKVAELSTEKYDWSLSFSPDGKTAFWAVSEGWFPTTRKARIVTARLENGTWSAPEDIPFSAAPDYTDMDPAVSPDGTMLVFTSTRPVDGEQRRDLDVWYVERDGDGWGEPVNLGEQVNSPRDELFPSVAADGTIYFASDRTGEWDIYRTRPQGDGTYGPAEHLGEPINSDLVWQFNPDISPDGQTLVFTMLSHPDGLGAGDMYLARRDGDGFDQPINLGECVNTNQDEYHPRVVWSGDQPVIYFVYRGDFYRANLPQE